MSRVAKNPITIPNGVTVTIAAQAVTVKGPKGSSQLQVHELVNVFEEDKHLRVKTQDDTTMADQMAGTTRALLNNIVIGVTHGFECKLELFGVGYRAAVQGKHLNLTLGFSHPVAFPIPEGITIQTPSQTEIVIHGVSKYLVNEVGAKIRAYRPPEPYKGKGVRYSGEKIKLKETKKK